MLPPAEPALLITGAPRVIVSVKRALPVPVALVAPSVTVETPADAGVPEIKPVEVLINSPVGKPAALKLVG